MQDFVKRPATYADVLAAPEHMVAEIIDGEMVTMPRPEPRRLVAISSLCGLINGPFDVGRGGPGGWRVLREPEVHLDEEVLVPHIAGWRRERLPRIGDIEYITLSPDWVCEIPSTSSARYVMGSKRRTYARQGVCHSWFVDTSARLLESYELRDGLWVLLNTFVENDEVAAVPFAEVPFPLGILWVD